MPLRWIDRQGRVHVEHPQPGVSVLELVGDHDMTTAGDLRAAFRRASARSKAVIVDVGAATFIDSTVLGLLFSAHRAALKRGRPFVLQLGPADSVRKVLVISGLVDALRVAESREEALTMAAAQPVPSRPVRVRGNVAPE